MPPLDGVFRRIDGAGNNTFYFVGNETPLSNGEIEIWAHFGDHKLGEVKTYTNKVTYGSKEEEKEAKARRQKALSEYKKQKEQEQLSVAKQSEIRWKELSDSGESAYLSKKGCDGAFGQRYGITYNQRSIYIPCRDISGNLWSLQKIQDDGFKSFTPGGRIKGCFHTIGEIKDRVYICEGFATAVSAHLGSNSAAICAFNAGNLKEVASSIRTKFGNKLEIIICCDNDQFTIQKNTGVEAGKEAALEVGGYFVIPQFKSLDGKPTDFNDLHTREGLAEVTNQLKNPISASEIIPTESTGFHKTEWRGNKPVQVPQYEDLRRFFNKQHSYRMLNGSGIVLVWNGKYYEQFEDAYVKAFAQEHFNPTADNRMVEEFLGIVRRHNLTPSDWFSATTKRKINFQNGVLDIETMEFTSHSRKQGFRYVLDYSYDKSADCPTFDKFIKDITGDDKELETILLEFAGYALSNDSCWTHKALVLEGEGSNGKSTFMNVLRRLAGQNNYSSFSVSDLNNPNNRQMIDGKLFNLAEETPKKAMLNSSTFKNLVSGGETHGCLKYKNPYIFRNRAKLIFACNEIPTSDDVTHGYIRRFLIVPFKQKFSKEIGNLDPFIEKKLFKELPGIFNRIIVAYKGLAEREDFTEAKASVQALEEYKLDIDPIRTFVNDSIECHPLGNGHDSHTVSLSDLYSSYSQKAMADGFHPVDVRIFGRRLKSYIPDYEKRFKRGAQGKKLFIGVTRFSSGEKF